MCIRDRYGDHKFMSVSEPNEPLTNPFATQIFCHKITWALIHKYNYADADHRVSSDVESEALEQHEKIS